MAHNVLIRSAADKWQAPPAAWVAATVYALGSFVVPTTAHADGLIFKATAVSGSGTSGAVEPTWPGALTDTVVDNAGANQITWTAYTTVAILSAELQLLDEQLAPAINGVDGSTHSVTGQNAPATLRASDIAYTLGQIVAPNPPNGLIYQCSTAGTSGGTVPFWLTTLGSITSDGSTLRWTCIGSVNLFIGNSGLQITGLLTVAREGVAYVAEPSGILLSDGDVPQYGQGHQGSTPTVVHAMAGGQPRVPWTWRGRVVDGAVQSVAPMIDASDGNGPQPARWILPLRMYDQATVDSVTVAFKVGWPHTSLPTKMPGARLLRVSASGIPELMTSIAAGADAKGFVYMTAPSTPAAWTGQQTLVLPVDQNNPVDITTYTYFLEIIEEQWSSSSGYPWSLVMKQPVDCASTAILSAGGVSTVDGVTLVDGVTRVLIKDGQDSGITAVGNSNGIYIAQSGGWSRAPDFSLSSDFSQGVLVPVKPRGTPLGGAANPGSLWQAASAQASWPGNASTAISDDILFLARGPDDDETPVNTQTEFFAHGNIWQAAAVKYSGITQQSFQ